MIDAKRAAYPTSERFRQAALSPPVKGSPALRFLLAAISRSERENAKHSPPKEIASRQAEFGLD